MISKLLGTVIIIKIESTIGVVPEGANMVGVPGAAADDYPLSVPSRWGPAAAVAAGEVTGDFIHKRCSTSNSDTLNHKHIVNFHNTQNPNQPNILAQRNT